MSTKMPKDQFLEILYEWIEFLNQQIGMHVDACSAFTKNRIVIERQVARISKASSIKIGANGQRVVMRSSYEDPSMPDCIHQRIIAAEDYIAENATGGLHERQHAYGIIIFIYAFWDEEIRYKLARAKGVKKESIKSDIMGDLRHLRNAILHNKGILLPQDHQKIKKLQMMFIPNNIVAISTEQMHQIIVLIKQDILRMINEHTGNLPDAPKPENIRDIAIQLRPKN